MARSRHPGFGPFRFRNASYPSTQSKGVPPALLLLYLPSVAPASVGAVFQNPSASFSSSAPAPGRLAVAFSSALAFRVLFPVEAGAFRPPKMPSQEQGFSPGPRSAFSVAAPRFSPITNHHSRLAFLQFSLSASVPSRRNLSPRFFVFRWKRGPSGARKTLPAKTGFSPGPGRSFNPLQILPTARWSRSGLPSEPRCAARSGRLFPFRRPRAPPLNSLLPQSKSSQSPSAVASRASPFTASPRPRPSAITPPFSYPAALSANRFCLSSSPASKYAA